MAADSVALDPQPIRSPQLLDVAIALGVFAASIAIAIATADPSDSTGAENALALALIGASTLPLAWRRANPLLVFVICAAASVALAFVIGAGPPLGPTLALYWGAADERRPRLEILLATAAALLLAHAAAGGLERGAVPLGELLWGTLVWGGALLAGEQTRLRRDRLAELERRAADAERSAERERLLAAAEERARIARELHDSAGHAINTILVHAGLGRLRSGDTQTGAGRQFETIEEVARKTVTEIDHLVGDLRDDRTPEGIEPPPGLAAVPALVRRHRDAGLAVEARLDSTGTAPAPVDRGAYRIVQEALTNAARHGNGSAELVVCDREGTLVIEVVNGLGPGNTARPHGGHGLAGMRERVDLLGGELEAGPRGGAFIIRARLPLGAGQG